MAPTYSPWGFGGREEEEAFSSSSPPRKSSPSPNPFEGKNARPPASLLHSAFLPSFFLDRNMQGNKFRE